MPASWGLFEVKFSRVWVWILPQSCCTKNISFLSDPWTLACEDGNSKLFGVVTVADDDAEKRVDESLIKIWKLKFGQDFGADVWLRF